MTLPEIMVVVAIIGALAVMASLGITKLAEKSRISTAEQDLARLTAAIEQLAWDTGKWPMADARTTQDKELDDLSKPQSGLLVNDGRFGSGWKGPYIDIIPLDPWGMKYFFDSDYYVDGNMNNTSSTNMLVVVGSYGPNKGGTYDSDNIYVVIRRR
jgi:prepilin-type N-terminal cleavage/methylation domain-containing protein